MTPSAKTSAFSSLSAVLRVLPMLAGAGLLTWRFGSAWAWVLLAAVILLLAAVAAAPAVARGFLHGSRRLEAATAQTVSWVLLGFVFLAIFIPGRIILLATGDRRLRGRAQKSYWLEKEDRPAGGGFHRMY